MSPPLNLSVQKYTLFSNRQNFFYDTHLKKVAEKLVKIETKLDSIDQTLSGHNKLLNKHEEVLSEHETKIAVNTEQIKELKENRKND